MIGLETRKQKKKTVHEFALQQFLTNVHIL